MSLTVRDNRALCMGSYCRSILDQENREIFRDKERKSEGGEEEKMGLRGKSEILK